MVDELDDIGISRMAPDEIEAFLAAQGTGVLGLPGDAGPALRPMSYWFDGDSRLYFVYVLAGRGRKRALSDRADAARFLVYRVDTPFNWTSVLLTGTLDAVAPEERAAVEDELELAWQPQVFEQASSGTDTRLYAFEIAERAGIKHRGLPAGFEASDA